MTDGTAISNFLFKTESRAAFTKFFIHWRLHYQFFILSAPFLLGALLANAVYWPRFAVQFFNVHVLLFGGATAFNSFWDKDEGPIGGLRHPPKMEPWMHGASLAMQGVGLLVALSAGRAFAVIFAVSAVCFWLYSAPAARWKGKPFLSFVAIGVSTGVASLLMGKLAAESSPLGPYDYMASVGVAAVLLSLYPVSQLYQLDADRQRGDSTFAVRYGLHGIHRVFLGFYPLGLSLLTASLWQHQLQDVAVPFAIVSSLVGVGLWSKLRRLRGRPDEYSPVMRLKYAASAAFVGFVVLALVYKNLFQG